MLQKIKFGSFSFQNRDRKLWNWENFASIINSDRENERIIKKKMYESASFLYEVRTNGLDYL